MWWNIIGVAFVVYDFVMLPLHYFFLMPDSSFDDFLSWVVPVFWTCDMLVSFRTGFWKGSKLFIGSRDVALNYLKTFFVFDLFVLINEWATSLLLISGIPGTNLLRVFRLIRLMRLLRLVNVWGKMDNVLSRANSVILRMCSGVFKLLIFILGINHLLACIWFAVGSSTSDGWVHSHHVSGEPLSYLYLVSYQEALSQFRGTHSSGPLTGRELVHSNISLVLGLIVVSAFIGTLTQFVAEVHEMWREVKQKDRVLCDYLHEFQVSMEVTYRAKKILSLAYARNILDDADSVLRQLPNDVLMDVHFEARAPSLCKHVLFYTLRSYFPRAFHRFCHDGVVDTLVTKYEVVFLPGDACHRTLFLWSGQLSYEPTSSPQEATGETKNKRRLQHNSIDLCKGSIVSEFALWTPWVNRGTLHTVEDSTMFAIKVDRLTAHAIAFVGVHAAVVLYARQCLEQASMKIDDLFEPVEFDLLGQADKVKRSAGKVSYDFFLSHTQRDDAAKLLATELYSALAEAGKRCWLDVKMDRCDRAAMMEGVQNADVFIAIVTDNGVDSYFSREMCREECNWAMSSMRCIVPVVAAADKHRITDFISEGQANGIDFSEYNFCQYDRSGPEYTKASVRTICQQARSKVDFSRHQSRQKGLSVDLEWPSPEKAAVEAVKGEVLCWEESPAVDARGGAADAEDEVNDDYVAVCPSEPDPEFGVGASFKKSATRKLYKGTTVERKKEQTPRSIKKKLTTRKSGHSMRDIDSKRTSPDTE
jgi:hypothetical protein